MVTEDEIFCRRRDDVLLHALGDEAVLHDTTGEQIHVLNHTSRFIWNRCDGETTVGELVKVLLGEYQGVDEATLRQDVLDTLDSFRRLGLLQEA